MAGTPLNKMTLDELRADLRALRREQRDKRLRAGKARPRTYREMEIFAADLLKQADTKD